jgi:hypothetical protein
LLETPGAYPRRKHLKGAPIGLALALPSNSKAWLERVSKDKRSSLLGLIISDKGKSFITLTPGHHLAQPRSQASRQGISVIILESFSPLSLRYSMEHKLKGKAQYS